MAYGNPSRGGLTLSHNGKTVGVWFVDAGNDMMALCAMEAVGPGQWEARWNSGFCGMAETNQKVSAAGGEVQWIKSLLSQINTAFAKIFGVAPASPPVTLGDKINDAIANSFTLTAGPGGVVFAQK